MDFYFSTSTSYILQQRFPPSISSLIYVNLPIFFFIIDMHWHIRKFRSFHLPACSNYIISCWNYIISCWNYIISCWKYQKLFQSENWVPGCEIIILWIFKKYTFAKRLSIKSWRAFRRVLELEAYFR